MSVTVDCKKCGMLAIFNYEQARKQITRLVDTHKAMNSKSHRVIVKRDGPIK